MSDLFCRERIERAKQRCRIARGGEKRRRQGELQRTVAAELLAEISEGERKRLTTKYGPLRRMVD